MHGLNDTGGLDLKEKERAKVLEQDSLAEGIFSLWLECKAASAAQPGQFVDLFSEDASRILPRPISICEIDREGGRIRLVYRAAGAGTKEFAGLKAGAGISMIGPLGTGYPLDKGYQEPVLIGGGIGIPPLVELARAFRKMGITPRVVLGYRREVFLKEEFEQAGCLVSAALEDPEMGELPEGEVCKGNVLDAIRTFSVEGDALFSCGPIPMLRGVKSYALEHALPCYLSLEERMACGVGACLGCVCRTVEQDGHSYVNNARICKDGPVFEAREVQL